MHQLLDHAHDEETTRLEIQNIYESAGSKRSITKDHAYFKETHTHTHKIETRKRIHNLLHLKAKAIKLY